MMCGCKRTGTIESNGWTGYVPGSHQNEAGLLGAGIWVTGPGCGHTGVLAGDGKSRGAFKGVLTTGRLGLGRSG
jgi:hypothetical protein